MHARSSLSIFMLAWIQPYSKFCGHVLSPQIPGLYQVQGIVHIKEAVKSFSGGKQKHKLGYAQHQDYS